MRPIILCFVTHFLPGYRSGGPARSIANFVDRLGDRFDVRIVTSDRDLGDCEAYQNISIGSWNRQGWACVYYIQKKRLNLRMVVKLCEEVKPDLIYLNSFFDLHFTIIPLLARYLKLISKRPWVIAPRGEFSPGALKLKAFRKALFLLIVNRVGFYKETHWQASSDIEKLEIQRSLGNQASLIGVAPDLTPLVEPRFSAALPRPPGPLRLIFLSRISPKKNLSFLFRVLATFRYEAELAIYGPKEDLAYWRHCLNQSIFVPKTVAIKYYDAIPKERVLEIFREHDLFVFPTLGENFGHVIFESLSAGTPVLTSDCTPWQQDAELGLQVLELRESLWISVLEQWANFDDEILLQRRIAAKNYASEYNNSNLPLCQNYKLFSALLTDSMNKSCD